MSSLERFNCFGHDDLLPQLSALLDRTSPSMQTGSLIAVSGGPGMGKSFLVSCLCRHFDLKPTSIDFNSLYKQPKMKQTRGLLFQLVALLDSEYDTLIVDDFDLHTDEGLRVIIESFIGGKDGLLFNKKRPFTVFLISCRIESRLEPQFDLHLPVSLNSAARRHILKDLSYSLDSIMPVDELAGMLNGYNYYNIRDFLKEQCKFDTKEAIQDYIKVNKPTVVKEMCDDEGILVSTDYKEHRLEHLVGVEPVIEELKECLVKPFENRQKYEENSISMPSGILIHGPSGTGKTHLAIAVAHSQQHLFSFLHVNAAGLRSKYLGETEKRISSVFQRARSMAPCIIFLDHIDHLLVRRDEQESTESEQRIVTAFLVELDGALSKPGEVVVLAVATDITSIDPAILRPGRLGHHIHMDRPRDTETIVKILDFCQENMGGELYDNDKESLAKKMLKKEYSQSDIVGVFINAAAKHMEYGHDDDSFTKHTIETAMKDNEGKRYLFPRSSYFSV